MKVTSPRLKIYLLAAVSVLFLFPVRSYALLNMLVYGPTAGCYADSTPGYNVTVWNSATWATKTTAEFAAFNVIVFADCSGGGNLGSCFTSPTTIWDTAIANEAVWVPAVTGNVLLAGTDTDFHIFGSGVNVAVVQNFVNFASAGPGTGLYVSLSCAFQNSAAGTLVPLLSGFGTFTAEAAYSTSIPASPYANKADIISASPALTVTL